MFEIILAPLAGSLLFDAVYYATRLIKHRLGLIDVKSGLIVKGLSSEPSPEAEQIALEIIKEIEQIEGIPLQETSKECAKKYVNALADIVRQRSVDNLRYDEERGRELLEELRKPTLNRAG